MWQSSNTSEQIRQIKIAFKKKLRHIQLRERMLPFGPDSPVLSIFFFQNFKVKIYTTTILPFVLHWCKSWSHTFKECHGLKILKICVQRGIFGPKKENITGKRTRLHNRGLHDQRKKSEVGRTCGRYGVEEGCTQGFGGQTSW